MTPVSPSLYPQVLPPKEPKNPGEKRLYKKKPGGANPAAAPAAQALAHSQAAVAVSGAEGGAGLSAEMQVPPASPPI